MLGDLAHGVNDGVDVLGLDAGVGQAAGDGVDIERGVSPSSLSPVAVRRPAAGSAAVARIVGSRESLLAHLLGELVGVAVEALSTAISGRL